MTDDVALTDTVKDIIKTYNVGREFHEKLSVQMIGEYNRLLSVGLWVVANVEENPDGTFSDRGDYFSALTSKAEEQWMDENHGSNPNAKKKDGSFKCRVFLPTAYSSAKSVVRRAIIYNTITKTDPETGEHLGKTALEKANKAAEVRIEADEKIMPIPKLEITLGGMSQALEVYGKLQSAAEADITSALKKGEIISVQGAAALGRIHEELASALERVQQFKKDLGVP